MYAHLHSKNIVSRLAALALVFAPIAGLANPTSSGSGTPSISGSPQMNLSGGSRVSSDSITNLVVILFSNEKDTLRDTLSLGMIPALEIQSVFENAPGKFTSISVQKTRSVHSLKDYANNDLPPRRPVW